MPKTEKSQKTLLWPKTFQCPKRKVWTFNDVTELKEAPGNPPLFSTLVCTSLYRWTENSFIFFISETSQIKKSKKCFNII